MKFVLENELIKWCEEFANKYVAQSTRTILESDDEVQLEHYCGGWDPNGDQGPGYYFSYYSPDGGDWLFKLGIDDILILAQGRIVEPPMVYWKQSPIGPYKE